MIGFLGQIIWDAKAARLAEATASLDATEMTRSGKPTAAQLCERVHGGPP